MAKREMTQAERDERTIRAIFGPPPTTEDMVADLVAEIHRLRAEADRDGAGGYGDGQVAAYTRALEEMAYRGLISTEDVWQADR